MSCENPTDPVWEAICIALRDVPGGSEVVHDTQNQLQEEREAWEKIRATVQMIGATERNFLHRYFGIPFDSVPAVQRLEDIQRQLGFSWNDVDWVVWPWTLKQIYIQFYSRDINSLPEFQRNRWTAFQEMQDYRNNPRIIDGERYYVSQIPDVFNDRFYWWWERWTRELFRPREGTMFAEGVLADGFNINQRNTPNSIQIFRLQWRNILALYDHIWNPIMVCYTSPGEDSHMVRGSHTLETSWNHQMHHLSRDHSNAPMAYGINIQDRAFGIMIHGGMWRITWYDESEWCYRIWLWYARFCYNYITQNTSSYNINIA